MGRFGYPGLMMDGNDDDGRVIMITGRFTWPRFKEIKSHSRSHAQNSNSYPRKQKKQNTQPYPNRERTPLLTPVPHQRPKPPPILP